MTTLALSFSIGYSFLQVTRTTEFEIRPDPTTKSMHNFVATLALSFLIGSASFLNVTRTCVKLG